MVGCHGQLDPQVRPFQVLARARQRNNEIIMYDQSQAGCLQSGVVAININANAPIVGPYLGEFLRGGAEIGNDTLARFYSLHMLVIPGGLFALIGLHLYLVVRLGITPPPWTKAAAGYEEVEDGRAVRKGLVDPKPRGNGAIAPRRPEG